MTAEQIVRALAAANPIDWDGYKCALCGALDHEEPHEPDCPWLMAVEWVAENATAEAEPGSEPLGLHPRSQGAGESDEHFRQRAAQFLAERRRTGEIPQ